MWFGEFRCRIFRLGYWEIIFYFFKVRIVRYFLKIECVFFDFSRNLDYSVFIKYFSFKENNIFCLLN